MTWSALPCPVGCPHAMPWHRMAASVVVCHATGCRCVWRAEQIEAGER